VEKTRKPCQNRPGPRCLRIRASEIFLWRFFQDLRSLLRHRLHRRHHRARTEGRGTRRGHALAGPIGLASSARFLSPSDELTNYAVGDGAVPGSHPVRQTPPPLQTESLSCLRVVDFAGAISAPLSFRGERRHNYRRSSSAAPYAIKPASRLGNAVHQVWTRSSADPAVVEKVPSLPSERADGVGRKEWTGSEDDQRRTEDAGRVALWPG